MGDTPDAITYVGHANVGIVVNFSLISCQCIVFSHATSISINRRKLWATSTAKYTFPWVGPENATVGIPVSIQGRLELPDTL